MNGLDLYLGYIMGSCYERAQRKDPDPEPDAVTIGIIFAIIIFPILVMLFYNFLPRIVYIIIAIVLILLIGFVISKLIYLRFFLKIITPQFWEFFLIIFCCMLVLIFFSPDMNYLMGFAILSVATICVSFLYHHIQHRKEQLKIQNLEFLKLKQNLIAEIMKISNEREEIKQGRFTIENKTNDLILRTLGANIPPLTKVRDFYTTLKGEDIENEINKITKNIEMSNFSVLQKLKNSLTLLLADEKKQSINEKLDADEYEKQINVFIAKKIEGERQQRIKNLIEEQTERERNQQELLKKFDLMRQEEEYLSNLYEKMKSEKK